MSEHTKGPWRVIDLRHQQNGQIRISGPLTDVANVLAKNPHADANARRIVACVNACEGIPTEDLALLDIKREEDRDVLEIIIERDRLSALNRELVEAASEAQCDCSLRERESGHRADCWFPNLRAVLAKVKSTQGRASGERDPENHQPIPKE